MADSVWDKAVQNIIDTQAQSRYTRTPINITNIDKQMQQMRKLIQDALGKSTVEVTNPDNKTYETTGGYAPQTNKINLTLYGEPKYNDVANALYHEDFHALFNQSGNLAPQPVELDTKGPIINRIISLIQSPTAPIYNAWNRSERGGMYKYEAPAYASAYKLGQLQGLGKEARDRYVSALSQALPDKASKLYLRMLKGYEASQQVQ